MRPGRQVEAARKYTRLEDLYIGNAFDGVSHIHIHNERIIAILVPRCIPAPRAADKHERYQQAIRNRGPTAIPVAIPSLIQGPLHDQSQ
jgi:hypothetical protein